MAISVPAATLHRSVNVDHSPSLLASTSNSAKLSYLSSLQFPRDLRRLRIGNRGFRSVTRPRVLPPVEAKKQTFNSFDDLLEKSDKPLLVDFYATWCGPCQFMVPILEEVNTTMKDKIQVVKIDTEKYPSIADKYKIEALPTFIIFKDGKPYDRFATRQSELWLKYRFLCCCKRCRAMPTTYVDCVLQETSAPEEEIEKLRDCFDDAIAEYLSLNNPKLCCEKLENLLNNRHVDEQLLLKDRETRLNLLCHLALEAYTTLASAYKVCASDLLALDPENCKYQVEGFSKSRASAAYSLLLAALTHHLFLSESSLIASAANYWGSAGESLLSLARSSVWDSISTMLPAVSESSSFLNHECYRSPQLIRFLTNSFCHHRRIVEFEEISKQVQNCIAKNITKTWSFLAHEGSFLNQINDLDFSQFLTTEAPTDSEATLTISSWKRKGTFSGSESECSNLLRGNLFQLGVHCLVYGAFLSSICYSQHSELVRNALNLLHSEGILAE